MMMKSMKLIYGALVYVMRCVLGIPSFALAIHHLLKSILPNKINHPNSLKIY